MPEVYRDQDGGVYVYTKHAPDGTYCEWDGISGHAPEDSFCGKPAPWQMAEREHPDSATMELCEAHMRRWTADHERLPS